MDWFDDLKLLRDEYVAHVDGGTWPSVAMFWFDGDTLRAADECLRHAERFLNEQLQLDRARCRRELIDFRQTSAAQQGCVPEIAYVALIGGEREGLERFLQLSNDLALLLWRRPIDDVKVSAVLPAEFGPMNGVSGVLGIAAAAIEINRTSPHSHTGVAIHDPPPPPLDSRLAARAWSATRKAVPDDTRHAAPSVPAIFTTEFSEKERHYWTPFSWRTPWDGPPMHVRQFTRDGRLMSLRVIDALSACAQQQVSEADARAEVDSDAQSTIDRRSTSDDPIEDALTQQGFNIYRFLKGRSHYTSFDTLRDRRDLWQKPDPPDTTIKKALERLSTALCENGADWTIALSKKRVKLQRLREPTDK